MEKAFLLFYNLLQAGSWPLWVLPFATGKRHRLFPKRLRPPREVFSPPVIWVQALSVGEAQAARGLLRALRVRFPQATILLSVTTSSGLAFAEKQLAPLVDRIFPTPLDLWPVVRAFVRRVRPTVYILIETDVWPNILWAVKGAGAQVLLVNGALSERAYQRLQMFPMVARLLYQPFDRILAASRDDAERLRALLPKKEISFWGNIKFDLELPEVSTVKELFEELGRCLPPPVIVCGSTHPGEEILLLEAYRLLGEGSLVICPRHPERAAEIVSLARQRGFRVALRSTPRPCEVLVVDTMGELRALYALAEVAFIGGTLVPVGGHNLIEPAALGVPVTFGPYLESIRNQAEEFLAQGAGLLVEPSPASLAQAWQRALQERKMMSVAAEALFQRHQGAVKRILRLLETKIVINESVF